MCQNVVGELDLLLSHYSSMVTMWRTSPLSVFDAEIKPHILYKNGLFGGLDDGRKSDEWEDGGRDAVGVKILREVRGHRITPLTCYPDKENTGCSSWCEFEAGIN